MSVSSHTTLSVWRDVAVAVLREHGIDDEKLFRENDVSPGSASRIDTLIGARIWHLVARATENPNIGLEAAQRFFQPAHWGSIGLSTLCSNNVLEAIQRFMRYSSIFTDVARFDVDSNSESTRFDIFPFIAASEIGNEASDFGMASFMMLFRAIDSGDLRPKEVHLMAPKPQDIGSYQQFWGCEIFFEANRLSMVFDTEEIARPLLVSNPKLAAYQDRLSDEWLQSIQPGLITKARNEILRLLPGGSVTADNVACALKLSTRSLQRKLSEEGSSFKQIQTSVRKELAVEYLQQAEISLQEITFLLGFADQSNFTRAFNRWYGVSPSKYLEDLGHAL